MQVAALLSGLHARGIEVGVTDDGVVRVRPPGRLTDDERAELRRRKPELVAALAPDHAIAVDGDGYPVAPCGRCGLGHFWRQALVPGAPWRCCRCTPAHPALVTDACSLPLSVEQIARAAARAAGMPGTPDYIGSVTDRAALFAAPDPAHRLGD